MSTRILRLVASGPQTIVLASALPTIEYPVAIDGTTQPGYAGKPLIGINGLFVRSHTRASSG